MHYIVKPTLSAPAISLLASTIGGDDFNNFLIALLFAKEALFT